MKVVLSQINFIGVLRAMSVTYAATLPLRDQTVLFLSALLHVERQRRGTRTGTRALGCFKQAVLILRWFLDGTRLIQLANDNGIARSTAYDYLHEGITVLAATAPSLESALRKAKQAEYPYVMIDGTLIETNRVAAAGPTLGVDLWWSGKHGNHGGNIQVSPGRLAVMDLPGTPRPRTRHHRPARAHRGAAPADRLDRRTPTRVG